MERRLMDRHNLQVSAILSFSDTTSKKCKTLNISGDGAFLITSQPKPVGTRVFMSLLVEARPDEMIKKKTVIKLEGIVNRITTYGMAICFDHRTTSSTRCDPEQDNDQLTEKAGTLPVENNGGEGGSRTHGTLAGTPDFESGSFGHSDTSPIQ